jgi:uncharacterized protein YdaU (DUF1376 family)
MHFYQKNIGDFNNATRHLTRVERSLFSDAIELYYDTEKPLTSDINKLNRLLLAHSQEEKDALLVVLNEFFTLTDDGYFNKRCNEEILKYQAYMESKSKAGKASAEQRAKHKATGVEQVLNTTPTKHNHEPITNNQETLKTKPTRKDKSLALPDYLPAEVWEQFKAMRTKIRKPLTPEAERLLLLDVDAIRKSGHDPISAINNSIKNSWQGIFEPKAKANNNGQPKTKMDISGIDYKAGVNPDGSF